ncbi:MAG: hypothetical protein ACI30N_08035 [Muribaculaceae bacterium]
MTVTVDISRVIDALYAIDGVRGVLADRATILGEELEPALCRLIPQAAAILAARVPALTFRGLSGDTLTFSTAAASPAANADTIETALSWLLLEMCRPGTSAASPTSGVLAALGNTAGDCPAFRTSHWQ